MKKMAILSICLFFSAFLISCTGPGTGPGGMYTEADRYRDQTNTAIAVGATAIGAAVVGTAIYNAGRHDGYYYHPGPPLPGPGFVPPPPGRIAPPPPLPPPYPYRY